MDDQVKSLSFFAPIEKTDDDERMVYGYASTEALDSQGEVVKIDALKSAISDYMKYANIREMHQPSAVGKTKSANIDDKGMYIAVKVVDDAAWTKVKEGVYTGFSIGGRIKTMVDNEITDLMLSEISLVDRPANPEAMIDVWKMDTSKKELKKSLWSASWLIDLALNFSSYIWEQAYEQQDVTQLKAALQTIKDAATMELAEAEDFPEDVVSAVELAEKSLSLKKAEDTTETVGETTEEDKTKETTEEKTGDVVEEKTVANAEEVAADTEVVADAPAEEKSEEEVEEKAEDTSEEKEVADLPVDIVKRVEAKVAALKVPEDDEIIELLKSQDIEVTEQTISIFRNKCVDSIVGLIGSSMKDQANKDAAKAELSRVVKKAEVVIAENEKQKNTFNDVLEIFKKVEIAVNEQIAKSTVNEVAVPKDAEVSPKSPAEMITEALTALQAAVAMLNEQNQGNGLTAQEKAVEEKAGHLDPEHATSDVAAIEQKKAEQTEGLVKLDGALAKIAELEAKVTKLEAQPEPIKVAASYQTVEKVFSTTGNTELAKKQDELTEALKRADELHELLKVDGNSSTLNKEAEQLSLKIMRLQREVNGSRN